jgi:hypothetical protein
VRFHDGWSVERRYLPMRVAQRPLRGLQRRAWGYCYRLVPPSPPAQEPEAQVRRQQKVWIVLDFARRPALWNAHWGRLAVYTNKHAAGLARKQQGQFKIVQGSLTFTVPLPVKRKGRRSST